MRVEATEQNFKYFNLGGGFHHARPEKGAGFCLINDIEYKNYYYISITLFLETFQQKWWNICGYFFKIVKMSIISVFFLYYQMSKCLSHIISLLIEFMEQLRKCQVGVWTLHIDMIIMVSNMNFASWYAKLGRNFSY